MSRISPPRSAPTPDGPQADRVRAFLALADAAAIALNIFRVNTSPLQGDPEFDNKPHTEERLAAAFQRLEAPMDELKRVRDAVFTDHPRTVALSFLSCLQDCYQSRGYMGRECEDPASQATQTFLNLRMVRFGPPGVDFGAVREPDDGWNSWREIFAADGRQLAEYGRIRTQIIGLAGVTELDIIEREMGFGLHPWQWPPHFRYSTADLVRMAEEAHRLLSSPATAVPEAPPGPPLAAPPAASPAARFPHFGDYLPLGFANPPEVEWPCANARRAEFRRCLDAANRKLAPAGARLPDAFYTYWTRRWADGFWLATQHGRPSLEGVRALIDFGDVIDAEFRLNNRQGVEPSDAEFTYYDIEPLRGAEGRPFPLGSHGKTMERDRRVYPIPFPRLATPVHGLAPRIRCGEFLAWAGFLAGNAQLTVEERADLNRVGVDTVGERGDEMVGWCVADGGDVGECQRIVDNLVAQLRQFTIVLSRELAIGRPVLPHGVPLPDAIAIVTLWLERADAACRVISSPAVHRPGLQDTLCGTEVSSDAPTPDMVQTEQQPGHVAPVSLPHAAPMVRPQDGPGRPLEFHFNGETIRFDKSERRFYVVLCAMWPAFRLRESRTDCEAVDAYKESGMSEVGWKKFKDYAAALNAILSDRTKIPATLEYGPDSIRWADRPLD